MTERVHYLNLGPWPGYIGITTSSEAFSREMKRLKVKGPDQWVNEGSNASTHFLNNNGSSLAIICIEPMKKRSREQYAALMAHEAVHVVQQMRSDLGDLGSEAEAYLVQQMVQEGLQMAWKTGRETRRKPQ